MLAIIIAFYHFIVLYNVSFNDKARVSNTTHAENTCIIFSCVVFRALQMIFVFYCCSVLVLNIIFVHYYVVAIKNSKMPHFYAVFCRFAIFYIGFVCSFCLRN